MKRPIYILGGIALFFSVQAQQHNKINEKTKQIIDKTYNDLVQKHKVVGLSLAIVDNGEIVYSTGYGFADRENKIAASDNTIYEINSCTKSFTSLSLLQLQEKGKLNIKNSIKDYIPELTISSRFDDHNKFYLNDIMCHVSGLPSDIWNGSFCDTPPDLHWVIGELNKQTAISPRRYKHAYSNIGYDLLGEVIVRQGKKTYDNYLKENIFLPLEMNATYTDPQTSDSKDIAKVYCFGKPAKEPPGNVTGAGGIYSNVNDMANFMVMLLNNGKFKGKQIISEASLKEMETNQLGDVLLNGNEKNYGYGMGTDKAWLKSGKDSSVINIIGHDGGGFAFRSLYRIIPELNIGYVLLTNTDNGEFIWFENPLLDIYLKEEKNRSINYNCTEIVLNQAVSQPDVKKIIGLYNLGDVLVNVKTPEKVKIKYGFAKMVLKQEGDCYSGKIKLLGFIPIKKADDKYSFVKLNNEIFIKKTNPWNKKEEYIGVKNKPAIIPDRWKKMSGRYQVTNNFKCVDCPLLVFDGMHLTLKKEKGFMVMKVKNKTDDFNDAYYLEIISDTMAVTGGIGRDTGETVKILDNGDLYYSGFEFRKKK